VEAEAENALAGPGAAGANVAADTDERDSDASASLAPVAPEVDAPAVADVSADRTVSVFGATCAPDASVAVAAESAPGIEPW